MLNQLFPRYAGLTAVDLGSIWDTSLVRGPNLGVWHQLNRPDESRPVTNTLILGSGCRLDDQRMLNAR